MPGLSYDPANSCPIVIQVLNTMTTRTQTMTAVSATSSRLRHSIQMWPPQSIAQHQSHVSAPQTNVSGYHSNVCCTLALTRPATKPAATKAGCASVTGLGFAEATSSHRTSAVLLSCTPLHATKPSHLVVTITWHAQPLTDQGPGSICTPCRHQQDGSNEQSRITEGYTSC